MQDNQHHPATESVLRELQPIATSYHRLILLVGESGAGKTPLLRSVANFLQVPCVNVGLKLSRLLLDVGTQQRMLRLTEHMADLLPVNASVMVLDNTEILFDKTLRQDPLRFLQGLSRNTTILAAWTGKVHDNKLEYATPEHHEYRQYPITDLLLLEMRTLSTIT